MSDPLLTERLRTLAADIDISSARQRRPVVFGRLDRRRRRRRATLSSTLAVLVLAAVVVVARGSSSQSSVEVRTATSVPNHRVTVAQLAAGKWLSVAAPPITLGDDPAVLWTGSRLFAWGGTRNVNILSDHPPAISKRAALFDPASGRWKLTSPAPLSPVTPLLSAWTGKEVVLWTGYKAPKEICHGEPEVCSIPGTRWLAYGVAYNPKTNRWHRLREAGAPVMLAPPLFDYDRTVAPVGIWNGKALLVLSQAGSRATGSRSTHESDVIGANEFDPATGRWRALPSLATHVEPSRTLERIDAVRVGGTIDVWLSWSGAYVPGGGSGVGIQQMFELRGSRWSKANVADPGVIIWQPVATGGAVAAFGASVTSLCPECNQLAQTDLPTMVLRSSAGRSRWRTVDSGPLAAGGQQVAAGALVVRLDTSITIGSKTSSGYALRPGDAAVLDPGSGRWTQLSSAPIDGGGLQLVWTGDRLIGFGQLTHSCRRGKGCRGGQLLIAGIELVPGR